MAEPLDLNAILQMFKVGPTDAERQSAKDFAIGRMGLGILAANQPTRYPKSSFGVLAQGGLQGMDAYHSEIANQLGERRLGAANALQVLSIKKALEQQEALRNFDQPQTSGAAPSVQPTQLSGPGMSPMTSQAAFGSPEFATANIPPSTPTLQVPNFRGLLAAGVEPRTVTAMMEDWKLRNPEVKFEGGVAVAPRTGMPMQGIPSVPKINQQGFGTTLRFDPQSGQYGIGVTPGAAPAYAQQQDIGERAKAQYEPFLGQLDPRNRPIPQTRLDFVKRVSPQTLTPGTSPTPGTQVTPGVGMGMDPAEKAAAEHLGTGIGTQATKVMTDAAGSALQLREIDQIAALTEGLNTGKLEPFKIGVGQWIIGSGLESPEWVKKNITDVPKAEAIMGAVNKMVAVAVRQTDAQPAVRQIDMLRKSYPGVMQTKEGLTLLTGILRDAHVYNIEKLREQQKFVASGGKLADFESHWTDVAKKMPLFKNFPQAAPIPKEPGQPPTVMPDKPPAAQHRGRIIEDESGKRFRSDGMSWQPL